MRTVCAANGSTRNRDRQVRLQCLFMVLPLGQLCPRLARVIRRVKLRNLVDDGLSGIRKGNTKKVRCIPRCASSAAFPSYEKRTRVVVSCHYVDYDHRIMTIAALEVRDEEEDGSGCLQVKLSRGYGRG